MEKRDSAGRWRSVLTTLPAIGAALLPRLACPCQMPAYAGLIGSTGLAFLMKTVYLLPLTATCLTFSVGGLALGAKRRRGYTPFWVGLFGAIVLIVGKFVVLWEPAVYTGIVLLLATSIWNSWPPRKKMKLKFNPDGTVGLAEPPKLR